MLHKKTVLIVFFIMGMLISGGVLAAEQPAITQEKALDIARTGLALPADLENLEVEYEERDDAGQKEKLWSFNWHEDGKEGYHVNVRVNALSGEIVDFYEYRYDTSEKRSLLPKVSRDAAEKTAQNLIQKLQPQKVKNIQLIKDFNQDEFYGGPVNYRFRFQRIENGIPVTMNSITVAVDGDSGKVSEYHYLWDDNLILPEPKNILTQSQAEDAFSEKIGLEMKYYLPYNFLEKEKAPLIIYAVKKPAIGIDAFTGEPVSGGVGIYDAGGYMKNEAKKSAEGSAASQAEYDIRINQGELSKEEALAIVKEKISIPSGYQLAGANYRRDYSTKDGRVWAFIFLKDLAKWDNSLNASVDSRSGNIVEYSYYRQSDYQEKPKFDREKCQKEAEEMLKRLAGDKIDTVCLTGENDGFVIYEKGYVPQNFHFTWVRTENGLDLENDRIDIDVSAVTGKVQWFRLNWSGIELSKPDSSLISLEEAYRVMFSEKKLHLAYIRVNDPENSSQGVVKLVYQPADSGDYVFIDAATGKLINSAGSVKKEASEGVFTDIAGHWAENEIKSLAMKKVVSGENGKFFPDSEITCAQFVKMLVTLKGIYIDNSKVKLPEEIKEDAWYYPYVSAAFREGIIKKEDGFQPNGFLTREYAAVMAARSMGYEKAAGIKGIYSIPVKDFYAVRDIYQGHVAIIFGLEILRGEGEFFYPAHRMSKAESAVMLVRLGKVTL